MQASLTRTTISSIAADIAMLYVLLLLSLGVRHLFGGQIEYETYQAIFVSLPLAIPIYWRFGLYPPILCSPQQVLRKFTLGTTTLYLIIFTSTFFFRSTTDYSRLALLLACFLSLFFMPVWHSFIIKLFAPRPWWGNSIILCGSMPWFKDVVPHLFNSPEVGLKPSAVVLLDDEDNPLDCAFTEVTFDLYKSDDMPFAKRTAAGMDMCKTITTLPCYNLDRLPNIAKNASIYAFMDMHSLDRSARETMAKLSYNFKKTFFVFSFLGHLNCWTGVADLQGILALETKQKLLDIRRQHIKRAIDILLTILGGIVFIPITIIIGIIIKLEDGGPIFYSHPRIGKNGKPIKILKFRTMVKNADKVLNEYLAKDEAMAKEWADTHKLRNDPRITKAGRWLRKSSLDELPQVWNVLKGELSFVGPRPIVTAEIEKYGDDGFALYTKVLPGLTGYWQISGRSNTSYERRVELDSYYIRNWSVWLDIYIIASTPRALINTASAC